MAYQALYRKYRPVSFDGVAGQKPIVKTLQNAVRQHRIAHAYLFCGPRGTGKTSIAKIFAKMLNCESEEHAPCGECHNCVEFQNGSHPDIIEIDAASNNGVEEVRNLIEKVKYAPIEGKYKVYIIDEVHMMSAGAFNALLKTIEEPPEHVIFIFATTEPHKVLPTIISRCQRFDFNKVSVSDMVERLDYVLEQEKIHMEPDAVRLVATLSEGGMRDALSILDQCIAYAQDNITTEDVNTIYGITTPAEKGTLLSHVLDREYTELMEQIEALSERGIDIRRLTADLIDLLKDSLVYSYTGDQTLVADVYLNVIKDSLADVPEARRLQMIDVLMETMEKYRMASDVSSYFEIAVLKMMNETPVSAVSSVQRAVSQAEPEQKASFSEPEPIPTVVMSVSRETKREQPEEKQIEKPAKPAKKKKEPEPVLAYEDEYIIALLAGANKHHKQQDLEKFSQLPAYLNELEWVKYANALKHAVIVGSGVNYLVLAVDSPLEAREINELERDEELERFIHELLGIQKKVFAIDEQQRKQVIQKFKEHMQQGTLPEPVRVELKQNNTGEKHEPTTEEKLTDLFGEEIVFMEE